VDIIADAFRRAHRTSKVLSIEEAIGPIAALPTAIVTGPSGTWAELLVAQALVILRSRGVPEPIRGPNVVFESLIKTLLSCEEISAHEHSHPEAGRKPAV
jgi:hypothetical protein